MTAAERTAPALGGTLSCFTANLAAYLAGSYPDPLSRIAKSVHLAVRVDLPDDLVAFSHHAVPLCELAEGRRLGYRGAATPAELLPALEAELRAEAAVLVVTHAGTMAWSCADESDRAPHFVLVTGHTGDRWRAVDRFSAPLAGGPQQPFEGWVPTSDLVAAMAPSTSDPVARLRKRHAFGVDLPVPPDGHYQWLAPGAATPPADQGDWTTGTEAALAWLTDFFAGLAAHPGRARFADDLWAAAQHHLTRYAHLVGQGNLRPAERDLVLTASKAWADLPMAVRFAADSTARGRPRPGLLRASFDHLRVAERRCADLLSANHYQLKGRAQE